MAAPQPAEQAADSVEQRQQPGAGASVGVAPQPADPPLPPGAAVLIRLTVYAAGEWLPAHLAAHRAAQRAGGLLGTFRVAAATRLLCRHGSLPFCLYHHCLTPAGNQPQPWRLQRARWRAGIRRQRSGCCH